jgi:acetyl esterase/lipase
MTQTGDAPVIRPVTQLYRPASTLRIRPRTKGNYRQECNHVYAEAHGMGLVMDVFRPVKGGNGLGIVDVISSGWHSDRVLLNEHMGLGIFDILCDRGYTVFAVMPGAISHYAGLQMVRHIREAIRHIKTEAAAWGIDPGRLGITGASAGGHLAALAALLAKPGRPESRDPFRRSDTRLKAAALFFPPADLPAFGGRLFEMMAAAGIPFEGLLYGHEAPPANPEELQRRMRELSPACRIRKDAPPFLLIHGDADEIVPFKQSELFRDALEEAGVPVELLVKEGGGHPWPGIDAEIRRMADWFATELNA